MIEEIKKEIELYIIKNHLDRYDELVDNIWEILDKYKKQENKQLQDKLKKIEKYCESTKEKYKYYNECNTTDVRVISKIIKGDD